MTTASEASPNPRDWIVLAKMSLPGVFGLYEWERRRAQTLVAEVGMALDLDQAAGGDLSSSVDYAAILTQIDFIAVHGRWRLLESLAAAVARHLLSQPAPGEARAPVDCIRIKVTKPDIFEGRAAPSIELSRDRAWLHENRLARSTHGGVTLESLTNAPGTAAYHVSLDPGAEWPLSGRSTALTIAGTVSIDHRRLSPGDRCVAPNVLRAGRRQGARVVVVGPRRLPREASHV